MIELTLPYLNKLAEQTILISSLLGGFSIAIVANLLIQDKKSRLFNIILITSVLATGFFLSTVFWMTKLLLMTTDGYPFKIIKESLLTTRIVGSTCFLLGTVSLLAVISLAGWTKSKKLGYITTFIGILSLISVFLSM